MNRASVDRRLAAVEAHARREGDPQSAWDAAPWEIRQRALVRVALSIIPAALRGEATSWGEHWRRCLDRYCRSFGVTEADPAKAWAALEPRLQWALKTGEWGRAAVREFEARPAQA